MLLWENKVYVSPVLGCGRALVRPVRIVVQMIRYLSRPKASDIAIVNISLDRLAQPGGSAGGVDLPAWKEHKRTACGYMRLLLRQPWKAIFL